MAASLTLHAAVLGPLAFARLGDGLAGDLGPLWPDLIEVVLLPRLPGEPSRGRATEVPSSPSVPTSVAEIGPAQTETLFRSGPVDPISAPPTPRPAMPQSTGPSLPETSTASIPDFWRVRPGTTASGPGPAPLNCRRAELLPPIEREVCAARYAAAAETRLGRRRLSRSESAREGGFAEQAAANEAWAAYRRSEDDGESYPGLISLMRHF